MRTRSSKKDEADREGEKDEVIPFMKYNVEQIEGLPSHYYGVDEAPAPEAVRLAAVDTFARTRALSCVRAATRPLLQTHLNYIQTPPAAALLAPEAQASTLLHELVH
jgi:antirestriction protein ArdC